ncbi:MAG: M28 family peptidase, partial [Oscillospiraceae bacterium]
MIKTRKIRDNLEKFGNIPAVNIRVADAFDIVLNKASKIKLTVKNNNVELTSNNIVATIKGTEYPEEIIAIGGHYDSVEFSTGVYDNGAGSVIVMELLRYFQKNPP